MRVSVRKWGNSLAVRIPKPVAEDSGIELGTEVDITLDGGRLVVTPVPTPRVTLDELVAAITPENLHGEISTGRATGREAW